MYVVISVFCCWSWVITWWLQLFFVCDHFQSVFLLFRRPPEEQAKGIRSGHPLQHRLSRTLPVKFAVGHAQAACQEGGVVFLWRRAETFLQHYRLRKRVPPAPAPEQQAGGARRHGRVARWSPRLSERQRRRRWRQPDGIRQCEREDNAARAVKDRLHLYWWHHGRPWGLGCY